MTSPASNWPLWQLIDSAFPVGGFAHSGGLEAAVQIGHVGDASQLLEFARASLDQSAALAAPFVVASVRDRGAFAGLDATYHALLRNAIASAASRTQGQAMIAMAGDVWPDDRALGDARAALRAGAWRGHWPIAFGLAASAAGADAATAADAFLFGTGRAILSAAVRLNLVGPRAAQRIQIALASERSRWVGVALATSADEAAQTSPALEMLQAQHGRLYSKLFVS